MLSWIHGSCGAAGRAKVVPEDGLRRWARFLRRYHDAVANYRPAAGSIWSSGSRPWRPGDIVCRGDFGPYNGVWQGDEIVGLIDWDHARPAEPFFDVAYALEFTAPFRPDEECVRWLHHPDPPDRRRRIEIFCGAYGVAVPDDVVDRVLAQQRAVLATCAELGRRGVEPHATWNRDGYLDTVRRRIRWTESVRL
jgi:aminoglycoside phosphotransferase (APT) family kinase protein